METLDGVDRVVHEPSREFVESTNVHAFMQAYDIADHDDLIERTCGDVDWFWDELPGYLDLEFDDPYDQVRRDTNGPAFTEWYVGGRLNIAHNVLDRHAAPESPERNTVACIWEGEPGDVREVTFHDLHREANQVANTLEAAGVGTGDTVGLYMPMVPEVISILYGCFKVGAIAVPIFSGFGEDAVATRLADADCRVLFTGDGFYRRGDPVELKPTADAAIETAGGIDDVIVYPRFDDSEDVEVPWSDGLDRWWADAVSDADATYDTESLDSSQESMLLYSSGTTGRPKGIVHTHAGVLTQCAKEIHFGFDHKPRDRFFWVSDIGWMMGPWTLIGNHTFAGTVFMYEGAPDHPDPDRYWRMIDHHDLTVFGISPTAIRALRKHGDHWLDDHDLSSLRLLGATGEPWDPESWQWFYEHVGGGEAPIINISGGTEICGCFLMPLPTQPLKPCTLGGPGLGMDVDIVNDHGDTIADTGERGHLVARDSCPSMTKSLWEGDDRYLDEYWSTWPGLWDHGDWAIRDDDGYWFLLGRADDALNVAGRKVGPAEIEGTLTEHDAVNRAAAIGVPDDTTGTAVVAYVVPEPGVTATQELRDALRDHVGSSLGKPFRPRELRFVDDLPRTQSGKVIRRAIRAAHLGEDPGDLSSMENPAALREIDADS